MTSIKQILPLLTLAALTLGGVGVACSDSDDDEGHGGWVRSRADVAPVSNPNDSEECGACHMAYQPGLLPADAWARIMDPTALADHYGDDASLSEELRREIAAYLSANAADLAERTRSRAFALALSSGTAGGSLPRISETDYFQRKHDEIPARMVKDNPRVGSFSQCNSCHRDAAKGVYNEHQVSIPGFGDWED
ncbi:diheme cytochrome c [Thiocystis violacea]|uniref:diheme cytochrome c n=1 Tax=Thiocystis violacea TaxID=13725 RepID=UPI001903C40E|nr:diheme cytochrome c [Thiocystis violacea]MBK1723807.1 cytochrome C [Thiocystis violacea]